MNEATRLDAFLKVLNARKVGEQHERSALAGALVRSKRPFDDSVVLRLMAHFATSGKDDPEWHLVQAIRSGEWEDLDADLLDEQRRQDMEQADAKRTDNHLRFVTATNPYGWANQPFMQPNDHNRPGEWNEYRQCYNMTERERREKGGRDYRYRGCSRYEVLGGSTLDIGWKPGGKVAASTSAAKTPTIEYDALAVSRAMGQDFGDPGASQGHSERVYGE